MAIAQRSETTPTAGEIMGAIASAPPRYRDAVIAVDVLGMTYRRRRTLASHSRGDARDPRAPRATPCRQSVVTQAALRGGF